MAKGLPICLPSHVQTSGTARSLSSGECSLLEREHVRDMIIWHTFIRTTPIGRAVDIKVIGGMEPGHFPGVKHPGTPWMSTCVMPQPSAIQAKRPYTNCQLLLVMPMATDGKVHTVM